MADSKPTPKVVVARNRKALHEYEIFEKVEAGIALVGTEVKALRDGKCNLTGAFARIQDEEIYLEGLEIQEYNYGNLRNHAPKRTRKLLLHRHQIRKLDQQCRVKGNTLVPLEVYFSGSYAKVELAVGRGKAEYDKRQSKAEKEAKREIARVTRRRG